MEIDKRMKNNIQQIDAVFERDLQKILKDLGVYDEIIESKKRCIFCNQIISLVNLEYIFSKETEVVISCNRRECIEKFKKINDGD